MNTITTLLENLCVQTAPAAAEASSVPAAQRVLHQNLEWSDVMQFLCVGLTIVFMTLIVLWIICEIMGRIFTKIDSARAARIKAEAALNSGSKAASLAPAPSAASLAGAAAVDEVIPPAVFVAAAAAMMGNTPCRVLSVQKIDGSAILPALAEDVPLAVIAAAVAEVMQGTPHKILSVRPVDMTWACEGRRLQMQ